MFTFEDAIALVPEEYRIPGMKVTFVSAYTNQAETWYFKGKSVLLWRDWESWQKIDFEAEKTISMPKRCSVRRWRHRIC